MAQIKVKCDICKYDNDDNAMYGEMISKDGLDVHYYCLLSAYNIPQKGRDKQGLYGFFKNDIIAAEYEFKNIECFLCNNRSAAVKCSHAGCDRFWHFPCGRDNDCVTQFIGAHQSYCNSHVPDTNIIQHTEKSAYCYVCYETIPEYHPATSIYSKCCKDTADKQKEDGQEDLEGQWKVKFVHSTCVQNYTIKAGYDSMCIMCGMKSMTKEQWQNQMRMKGIFVPMKMAEWENDPHYKSHVKNKCTHASCPARNNTKDVWTCRVCGCFPLHLSCARVASVNDYLCPKCMDQSFVGRVPILY